MIDTYIRVSTYFAKKGSKLKGASRYAGCRYLQQSTLWSSKGGRPERDRGH